MIATLWMIEIVGDVAWDIALTEHRLVLLFINFIFNSFFKKMNIASIWGTGLGLGIIKKTSHCLYPKEFRV